MKINRIHAVLGAFLVIIPLLGVGHTFKNAYSIFAGAVILFFAVQSIQFEYRKKHRRSHKHDAYVEGRPPDTRQDDQRGDSPTSQDASDSPIEE